jgi:DNA invertase Pin-like site-specific DNA recombinase
MEARTLLGRNPTGAATAKRIRESRKVENDIRHERQQDGINKAKARGVRFGPKPLLTAEVVQKVKELRADGLTVPEIMRRMKLSKASIYRALAAASD